MNNKLSGLQTPVITSLSKIINENQFPSSIPKLERKFSSWLDGKYSEDNTFFTPSGTNYQIPYDKLFNSDGKCFFDVRNRVNWNNYKNIE
jgi:hypothetical protein